MNKVLQNAISLLIVFCLTLQSIPVYALDLGNNQIINNTFGRVKSSKNATQKVKREISYEIIDKRENNKKCFKMSDGSEKVNLYSTIVHFKDNGKYVEIDNELVQSNGVYTNKKAPYKVRYEKENKNGKLLQLQKDDYSFSMSLDDSNKSIATIPQESKKTKSSNDVNKKELIPNISSSIEYNNIKNKVDINYVTLPTKVKESIILKDSDADKEFKYNIDLNKPLIAELKDHNIIEFKEETDIIFTVETPYMYDSEFNISTDIEIKLEPTETGYVLNIKPNKEWLKDKNRKYPVVIDPTINTSTQRNQIDDVFIFEGDEYIDPYAKANQHILRVGSNRFAGTHKNPTRSLIRFNLPTLNTGDQVIEAKLGLFSYACGLENISCPAGKPIEINVHKVTKEWNDSNAKWSHMGSNDSYDSKVVDYQVFNFDWNNQVKLYKFDITSIAKDWYVSGKNNGLLLKEANEVKNLNREDAYFFSSDISENYKEARPIVSITYRNQTGLENYQTFSSSSIGGIDANINNYNGNLVLDYNDASTPSGRLPVSINHIYNTNDKDINLGYGNGFRLNLNQSITIAGDYLKYIDEDGTRHWFKKTENKYKDEDGLNLTIYADGSNFRMEDKEGNNSYFSRKDNTWYLTEIKDTSGNKIRIELNPNDYNKILKVTDGAGDALILTYDNNLLTSIKDPASRMIKYNYNGSNLISITNFNNDMTTLDYSNNLVTKINSYDKTYNTYEYYEKVPYRLKKVVEYGSNENVGNSLEFVYGENVTSIKDAFDKTTNYVSNNLGQTTSITDLANEKSVKNAYGQVFEFDTSDGDDKNKLKSEGKVISYKSDLEHDISKKNLIKNGDFEKDLESWTRQHTVSSGDGIFNDNGNKVLKINGNIKEARAYNQYINTSGEKGEALNISFWVLNAGVPNKNSIESKIQVDFFDNNGKIFQSVNLDVANDSSSWQFINKYIIASQAFSKIKITPSYFFQKGYILFDNISVYKDERAESYSYDGKGNVISSHDVAKQNNNFTYDSDNQLVSSKDNKGRTTLYSYDYEHKNRLLSTFEQDGIQEDYTYDFFGNQTFARTYSKNVVSLENVDSTQNYYIKAYNTDLYISPNGSIESNGSQLFLNPIQENLSSEWTIVKTTSGKYEIRSAYSKNEAVMDVTSGGIANGTAIHLWENQGGEHKNQTFQLIENTDGSFTFKTKATEYNKCIDVRNGVFNVGSQIQQYECNGSIAQKFILVPANNLSETKGVENTVGDEVKTVSKISEDKVYYIKSRTNNLFVSVDKDKNVDGNKVLLKPLSDDGLAEWYFVKKDNDKVLIKSYKSTIYAAMDIKDYNTNNHVQIQIWSDKNDSAFNSRLFELSDNGDGTFSIKTKLTNYKKCLEVSDGWFGNTGNIKQYDCNNTLAQKFIILEKDISKRTYIETSNTYDEKGKYLTSTTDERGKTNSLVYNENTGTQKSQTDANGNITNYEYDVLDRHTKISNGETVNTYSYDKNKLSKITHNGFSYNFTYDEFGNILSTKVNDQILSTDTYAEKNGNLLKHIYGNGNEISYEYDIFDRMISQNLSSGKIEYKYDSRGNLGQMKFNNHTVNYTYDLSNRVTNINQDNKYVTDYMYDKYNNISEIKYILNGNSKPVKYTYDIDNKLTKVNDVKYSYDDLNRISYKNFNNKYKVKYTYLDIDKNKTTNTIKQIETVNNKLEYTYDNNGNIKTIKESGKLVNEYEYDNLNQLSKEHNNKTKQTIIYTYDNGGNILNKKYYKYKTKELVNTINYTYNSSWKDQLTNFNGKDISYDEIGNPLKYGNDISFTWQNGRQLSSYKDSSKSQNIFYEYNEKGIRAKKTINGKEYKYYLENNNIIFEETPNGTIYYIYDDEGITGLEYNNKSYYYQKNQQRDIIGLLNENFELIATYNYDSWGKLLSIKDKNGEDIKNEDNIALINPFRYRSYYYDSETGLYYLNSRYYNPEMGRFINADGIIGTKETQQAYNLYSYTGNNPINLVDQDGEMALSISAAASFLLGAVIVVGTYNIAKGVTKMLTSAISKASTVKSTHKSSKSSKKQNTNNKRNHTVYALKSGKNIVYIGRTTNVKKRESQHKLNPARLHLQLVKLHENLTKEEARGLEQIEILHYRTLNRNNPTANQINGIAWDNKRCSEYINAALDTVMTFKDENEVYVGYCKY